MLCNMLGNFPFLLPSFKSKLFGVNAVCFLGANRCVFNVLTTLTKLTTHNNFLLNFPCPVEKVDSTFPFVCRPQSIFGFTYIFTSKQK